MYCGKVQLLLLTVRGGRTDGHVTDQQTVPCQFVCIESLSEMGCNYKLDHLFFGAQEEFWLLA